jgi:hypothetical protein
MIMEYQDLLKIIRDINKDIGRTEYDAVLSATLALVMTYPLKDDRLSCQDKIEQLILQSFGGK